MAGNDAVRRTGARAVGRALLYARAARRPLRSAPRILGAFGRPSDELVFVFGCPRSGTTFFAGALGSLPGFVDLGEVLPLKAAIPELARLDPEEAAPRIRRVLLGVSRLGLVGPRRGVEQTPETAFVLPAVATAFPRATLLHLVRDGRDVACSLLERGWLRAGRGGDDDVRTAYGSHARFWVEAGREQEFADASDARRAAWAWRRHVESARESGVAVHEVRYERVVSDPEAAAADLAPVLGVSSADLAAALRKGHPGSVGRHRRDLTPDQLEEVEHEAGRLLEELGYAGAEVRA